MEFKDSVRSLWLGRVEISRVVSTRDLYRLKTEASNTEGDLHSTPSKVICLRIKQLSNKINNQLLM